MDSIGSKAGFCANGVVVGVFDVGKVDIPVVLVFVANHGWRFCNKVDDMFDATVAARMVGVCREVVNTEELVNSAVATWAQNWSLLSERRVDGHPQREMKRFTKMLAVPSAVNVAAGTADIFARQLKRSVKRSM